MQYIKFEPWPQLYCKSWTPVPELCPCVFFTPHLPIRSPLLSPYLFCPLILSSLPLFLLSHPLPPGGWGGGPSFSSSLYPCSSPLLCPLSSHAPQISMAVADSDFASKMKNRQMGSSGGMNMTKSTSISGDMCNLEKTDGSQSDTAVGTVGTDDKKRRSSIGAKMQAMVGMSRKSRSTSQLSQTGREWTARSAYCSYVYMCIVLCSLCVLFSVLHHAYCCSNPIALFLPSTFLDGIWSQTNFLLTHFFPLSILQETALLETPLSPLPAFISSFHHCCTAAVVFLTRTDEESRSLGYHLWFHFGKCVPVTAARSPPQPLVTGHVLSPFSWCAALLNMIFFHYLSLLVVCSSFYFFLLVDVRVRGHVRRV